MNNLFKAALGIPDPEVIGGSGGRALLDPVGAGTPSMRQYTDPFGLIYKGSMENYATGLTPEEQRKKDMLDRARALPENSVGFKKGGKVKKVAKGGAVGRGDGIARKGKTKGRMV